MSTGEQFTFSNFADQRLYRQEIGSEPVAISPEGGWRYADGVIDDHHNRIICVREDHTGSGEAVNTIASLSLDGRQEPQVLVSGNDFYASPRISSDGTKLAWLCWNHPNMPWDGTELWVGELTPEGTIGAAQKVAGGLEESIFQPEWSPDGVLCFVSDRTNWWNLYRWSGEIGQKHAIEPLCPMEAEFGSPQWIFGQSNYAFASAERLICTYTKAGISYLASLNLRTKALEPIEIPYTEIAGIHAVPGKVVFHAGSATEPGAIVQLDLATQHIEGIASLQQSRN
ncbi:TolB family protein [Kovacikia minuta]|uniref:TolB family protein n=1 Tax=Kovacikia minuta TaxID=2931930 RepID=UPI0020C74A93